MARFQSVYSPVAKVLGLSKISRHDGDTGAQEYRQDAISKIVLKLLRSINYKRPSMPSHDNLVGDILLQLKSWEVNDAQHSSSYIKLAQTASGAAELCYPFHSNVLKKQIAMFVFIMFYMDDLGSTMPNALMEFQRRMTVGLPQLDPVLQQFPGQLARFYEFYDPLCANSIAAAALEFVTGTALETRDEILTMDVNPAAKSWPYFLRAKTGLAPAFGYMVFELEGNPDIAGYLQSIPDINKFIELTNDVLSFYKEELAGETHNYIHNRARCEGIDTLKACADVATECAALDRQICVTLASAGDQAALKRWQDFKTGYINFHVSVARYKLSDIGV